MSLTGGSPFSGKGSEGARAGDSTVGHPLELSKAVVAELPNLKNIAAPTAADFTNPGALSMLNHQLEFYDSKAGGGPPSDISKWMSSPEQGASAAQDVLGQVMKGFGDLGKGFAGQDQPPPPEQQQNNEYAEAAQRDAEAKQREQKQYEEAAAASAAQATG